MITGKTARHTVGACGSNSGRRLQGITRFSPTTKLETSRTFHRHDFGRKK